ncbi:ArnT family glycosyltransferase [Streptomyces sp. SCSIO ZS0520]|uniref:ArnT family glycosyltransferase n=1 Tax=Streptomyces sp. SCSIO ZS0520 TaxID=2892996 RepID=UPI0021DA5EC5|nr:glycosyltransferase family 39 protein [Streptomyces sp. SCSIO ZS0520]
MSSHTETLRPAAPGARPPDRLSAVSARAARGAARLWRGRPEDARWVRPAFLGLLLLVAVGYLWDLSASGWSNSFYSAAAQAGSADWKAFFFGSLDAGNAITVDKPPAALWPMALSVRLFGLDSWAILVPEALMGVGTAAVLYAAVRRRFSAAAGLLAVAVFATTPVAALMFRFNNPDALLTLLMTVTVYAVLRALEAGRTAWLLLAGAAVGLAFLTKTLQAFLILPPLALVYAVCAPVPLRRRLGQLLLSGVVLVFAGGWWVALVELWPAGSRPYIGGSQHNSFLELTFGYNGLGRINGNETGSVGGGGGPGGGGGRWGDTGLLRMLDESTGAQVAWLLPAALLLLIAGLVLTRRAPRTDTARAAHLAWGGSLLATGLVFSFMAGIFHQYYTVALAPYLAAVVAMGATGLWERRAEAWPALLLGAAVAGTAVWAHVLLKRTPDHLPWLRWAVLLGGLAAAVLLALAPRLHRALARGALALALAACLAGPVAYTLSTLNSPHTGSIPTAGPAGAGMPGFGGGRGPGGGAGGPGGPGGNFPGGGQGGNGQGGNAPGGNGAGGGAGQGPGGAFPGGGQGPGGQAPGGQGNGRGGFPGGFPGGGTGGGAERPGGRGGGGGMGGLLGGQQVSAKASALLKKDADRYTWAAAAIGSQNAASYQLSTGKPVMAIGGFNGTDPSPTLAQFQQYVADGRIHYFLAGGGMGGGRMDGGTETPGGRTGGGERGTSSAVSTWVESHFTKVTVGESTFYDLTKEKSTTDGKSTAKGQRGTVKEANSKATASS